MVFVGGELCHTDVVLIVRGKGSHMAQTRGLGGNHDEIRVSA